MPKMQAALQGSQEIGFAVVAMTLTLAAVYAPVAFMTGRTGKLFIEFALTLAGAVLVSGFVALTLSPMMCSLLLRLEDKHCEAFMAFERFLGWVNSGYRSVLTAALNRRWVIVAGFVAVALSCGVLRLPLVGVVDFAAELRRLDKEIAKAAADAGFIEQKLGREDFVRNAPPEVVAKDRRRLEELREKRALLAASRDRVAALVGGRG